MLRVQEDELELLESLVYRYKGKFFTGIIYQLDDEGRLIGEETIVEGVKHGPTREYDPETGDVITEIQFRHNSLHGKTREFGLDQSVWKEIDYEYAIKVRERIWDEDGKLIKDVELKPGDQMYGHLEASRRIHKDDDYS